MAPPLPPVPIPTPSLGVLGTAPIPPFGPPAAPEPDPGLDPNPAVLGPLLLLPDPVNEIGCKDGESVALNREFTVPELDPGWSLLVASGVTGGNGDSGDDNGDSTNPFCNTPPQFIPPFALVVLPLS